MTMEAAELQNACSKLGISLGDIATASESTWLHVWRVLSGEKVDEGVLRTVQGMLESLGYVPDEHKSQELYCYVEKGKLADFLRMDRMNHPFIAEYLGLTVKSWVFIWSGFKPVPVEIQKMLLELFPGVEAQDIFVWEHQVRPRPERSDGSSGWRQYVPTKKRRKRREKQE